MHRRCSNEEADDIATGHLQYLRIPSLMADLQAQTSVQGPEARLAQLSQASRNYIRSGSCTSAWNPWTLECLKTHITSNERKRYHSFGARPRENVMWPRWLAGLHSALGRPQHSTMQTKSSPNPGSFTEHCLAFGEEHLWRRRCTSNGLATIDVHLTCARRFLHRNDQYGLLSKSASAAFSRVESGERSDPTTARDAKVAQFKRCVSAAVHCDSCCATPSQPML